MKINLLLDNTGDVRSGYINIDPFAPDNDAAGRLKGDISNLDHVVDDGEAIEIIALEVLDYFPGHQADAILTNWLKKLARSGRLTLSVVDVREVARAICANEMSPEDINEHLHGKQEKPWQYRKSAYTLTQIAEVLGNLGYKILARRVQNFRAVITVERI